VPAVYDLSNPYDLLSPQHYHIPTGSIEGLGKDPRTLPQYPKGPSMAAPIGPIRFMASPGQTVL